MNGASMSAVASRRRSTCNERAHVVGHVFVPAGERAGEGIDNDQHRQIRKLSLGLLDLVEEGRQIWIALGEVHRRGDEGEGTSSG